VSTTTPSGSPARRSLEHGDTNACLAEVLARAGKLDEARAARDRAIEICERKEAPTFAADINRRLDALAGAAASHP
jgi:predicted RNA polymerase sigma factor